VPGDLNWGKGLGQVEELRLLEGWLNDASADKLEECASELRSGENLMPTLAKCLTETENVPKGLSLVEANWFGIGGDPMWLWDCTLGLEQMHYVLRESSARICLLLAAARRADTGAQCDLWLQCGHPRLSAIVAWDGATIADAERTTLPPSDWKPKAPTGLIREWIFIPFNSGYLSAPPANVAAATTTARATLEGYIKQAKKTSPRTFMTTYDDIRPIVENLPATEYPWKGTKLAVQRSAHPLKGRSWDGLSLNFIKRVLEPPESDLGTAGPPIPARNSPVPGIEISWARARKGVIPNDTKKIAP
jgi:hypothetical protein